jgi:hypothetical protein
MQESSICAPAVKGFKSFERFPHAVSRDERATPELLAPLAYRATSVTFGRMPVDLLGKLLDHGHASAYAVHLLAIKCLKGPGFVLNEKAVEKCYRIKRPSFQAGLRLLRGAGVLKRWQPCRTTWAVEQLAPGKAGYVPLTEELLQLLDQSDPEKCASKLVAFILIVTASPVPVSPEDAARRIGITSSKAARKLKNEAIATGEVEHIVGPHGAILLARKGSRTDLGKNLPAKNLPAKNQATHSSWTKAQEKEEPTKKASSLFYPEGGKVHLRALPPKNDAAAAKDAGAQDPDWQVLSDWTATRAFRSWTWGELPLRQAINEGKVKVAPVIASDWEHWLARFAGQEPVPGHLKTPAALRQVSEIVHWLCAVKGRSKLKQYEATAGLAFAVVQALASGKPIRSLGFIAQALAEKIQRGDLSWCYDLPSRLPADEAHAVSAMASKWVGQLEACGFPVDREELLSTLRIEALASMLRKYTQPFVVEGINIAIKQRRPSEGQSVCGWGWFEDEILAEWERAGREMAKREARQAQRTRKRQREMPAY